MKLLSLLENIEQFDEVLLNQHADDRMLERFLGQMAFPLMVTTRDSEVDFYKRVGTYFLSDKERLKILDKVNDFMKYEMPAGKRYGVVFHTFNVYDTKGDNVIYPKLDIKHQVLGNVVNKGARLYITDKVENGTVGDVLFGIVVDNQLETFFFNRSQTMSAKKHGVDEIIDSDSAPSLMSYKVQKNPPRFV
jgi:hypothetical protein